MLNKKMKKNCKKITNKMKIKQKRGLYNIKNFKKREKIEERKNS